MAGIPESLRAGSPALNRGENPYKNFPAPSKRSSVDRMSQLFPARPPSIAAVQEDTERRYSYPSPIVSSPESPYSYPAAPAPPSFSDTTAYDPAADVVSPISPSTAYKPSRSRSILNAFGSVSKKLSGNAKYGRLEGEEQDLGVRKSAKGPLPHLEEEPDGESIPFDVSGFDGFPLHQLSPENTDNTPRVRDSMEVGLAAEFERLEAQSKAEEQFGLGNGMRSVLDDPFLGPPTKPTHKRNTSGSNVDRDAAQKAADNKGAIVAVTEFPTMDIGLASGGILTSKDALKIYEEGHGQTSYYFPDDPDKPSWKPTSMQWPYITLLIIIALLLAAFQEVLCQWSSRHEDMLLKFQSPQDVTVLDYFAWKYAPTMVLVTYGIMWQITDFEVKRLEPYFQLSKKQGAPAAESLSIDYLRFISYLTPLKAIRYRHWAVVFSSTATLLAGSLAPVLQSASLRMYPDRQQSDQDGWKKVGMDPIWSRLLSAALLMSAISGIVLLFQLRRKSGLLSDPKGIAGVAAMATKSHILQDFHGLDRADERSIHKQLKHRTYLLHKSTIWQGKIMRHSGEQQEHKISKNPQLRALTLTAGIPYIAFMICIAIAIPLVLFVPGASIVTEKLPFLLTALATIVKFIWNTLDSDVRLIEPYFILSKRHAPPRILTLDYTGTPPGWVIVKAMFNRHFLVALSGLGAIMAEVLTVCMSSFSVDGKQFLTDFGEKFQGDEHDDKDLSHNNANDDETFTSFWVSFALSLLILFSLCSIAMLIYSRRRHKFCPRPPGTIASVLAYIHRSNMLTHFIDTQEMNSQEMTHHLESLGKKYGLGWFHSKLDNQDHCGIDVEELDASYVHGENWSEGRMNGPLVGDWNP